MKQVADIPSDALGLTYLTQKLRPEFRAMLGMGDVDIRLAPNLSSVSKYASINTPIHEGLHATYLAKDPASRGGPPLSRIPQLFEYYNQKFPALRLNKVKSLYERAGYPADEAMQEAVIEGMSGNMIERLATQGLIQ